MFKKGNPGVTSTIDDTYKISASALAPNGRLLAITRGLFDSEGNPPSSSSDIWLINMNGEMKNLTNSKDIAEIVEGWSPQGNRIIFRDYNLFKFYLMEIEKN
jgi:Tol biopolymer transport system component